MKRGGIFIFVARGHNRRRGVEGGRA